jgi:hypothetical protein
VAGIACAAAGAVSFVYGLKASQAINRAKEAEDRQGLRLGPAVLPDGRGRYGPGVMVSMRF